MGINLHKLNKKLGLEHCVVQREPGFVPSGYFVHDVMVEKHVIIIITTIKDAHIHIQVFLTHHCHQCVVANLWLSRKRFHLEFTSIYHQCCVCLELRWRGI